MRIKICNIALATVAACGLILATANTTPIPIYITVPAAVLGAVATGVIKFYKC